MVAGMLLLGACGSGPGPVTTTAGPSMAGMEVCEVLRDSRFDDYAASDIAYGLDWSDSKMAAYVNRNCPDVAFRLG